jgi:hypothetical protein
MANELKADADVAPCVDVRVDVLLLVQRAAEAGARCVSRAPPVVRDAGEIAVEKFEAALIRSKSIADAAGWAFQVGRNTAKAIGKKRYSETQAKRECELCPRSAEIKTHCSGTESRPSQPYSRRWKDVLVILCDRDGKLTERQRTALNQIDPDLSTRANARRLRTSPYNFRRMLATIKKRLGTMGP